MSQETPQPVSPRDSTTPLISSAQRDEAYQPKENATAFDGAADDKDPKTGKRRFFGLGKKKEDTLSQKDMASSETAVSQTAPASNKMRVPSPLGASSALKPQPQPIPISPSRNTYQSNMAASPSRLRSSSPRLHSPASSEIFERNVQEPVQISQLQGELSPAHIPSHMITEDHIPPALEAATETITSENLNPDEVEIVMSASHQPAASVLETSASTADLSQLNTPLLPLHHVRSEDSEHAPWMHQSGSLAPEEDGASNYGQLDPTDVRRLSFISFADVVQSEHQAPPASAISETGNRDSLHMTSLSSNYQSDRSASPLRSPRSPTTTTGGVTTPPPGVSVFASNPEQSPGRSMGGPTSPHSELTIETMRQAVRKTASGDLSGGRSALTSPVSDENLSSAPRSRTNS